MDTVDSDAADTVVSAFRTAEKLENRKINYYGYTEIHVVLMSGTGATDYGYLFRPDGTLQKAVVNKPILPDQYEVPSTAELRYNANREHNIAIDLNK
ncbi:hypothetical protein LJC34_05425 [Oscillospiraceae bacterium OttesenSCG-928-G22]|nr:hypothetical protein [Oscillospiraceae bacterium OttesenSCG-928-G22]